MRNSRNSYIFLIEPTFANLLLQFCIVQFTPSWKQTVENIGCASSLPRYLVTVAIEEAPERKTKHVKTCDLLGPFTGGYVLTFLGSLWHYRPPAAAHLCADLDFFSNLCLKFG